MLKDVSQIQPDYPTRGGVYSYLDYRHDGALQSSLPDRMDNP